MISIFRIDINRLRSMRMSKTRWRRAYHFSQYNQDNSVNIRSLTCCRHFLLHLKYTWINCVLLLQWYDRKFFLFRWNIYCNTPSMFALVIWLFTLRIIKNAMFEGVAFADSVAQRFHAYIVHPDQWRRLIYIWQTCLPPTSHSQSTCYNPGAAPLNN